MTETWEQISVNKPGQIVHPSLGQTRLTDKGKERPLGPAESKKAAHGRCIDHVKVDGLAKPVCILRGDDPEAVIAEALDLLGDA